MKSLARSIVASILAWQVRRLRAKNSFKIIGVVGSIGKTSSKLAIAQVLGTTHQVRFQTGNYNDYVSVPLVFFGHDMPSLFNPIAWIKLILANERHLRKPYPYDTVVLELGTDGPGQISAFKRYLKLDIAVVAAITQEHMEYFEDLDAVAKEELSVLQFSDSVLINTDLVKREHLSFVPEADTYGIKSKADYYAGKIEYTLDGLSFEVQKDDQLLLEAQLEAFSDAHLYSALAAIAVTDKLGLTAYEMTEGLKGITPVAGRMQMLDGINGSRIIDDSYNASPEAVKSALETLYRIDAPQKIALLGNMNELGSYSPAAHTEMGNLCDPTRLSEVITLGPDANKYTAPAARALGCKVTEFTSPYEAGDYIASILAPSALVLVKGSQNKVFAEEAIKRLLRDPSDEQRLVRQSSDWLAKKLSQFTAK